MQFISPEDHHKKKNSSTVVHLYNPSGFILPFELSLPEKIRELIENQEGIRFRHLEVVYVDEHEIQQINFQYLEEDYITDIISFRYDENKDDAIEGTLYCCAPRIAEQAAEYGTDQQEEFLRVFIHGLLHLSGYHDDTPEKRHKMSKREDHYLEQSVQL